MLPISSRVRSRPLRRKKGVPLPSAQFANPDGQLHHQCKRVTNSTAVWGYWPLSSKSGCGEANGDGELAHIAESEGLRKNPEFCPHAVKCMRCSTRPPLTSAANAQTNGQGKAKFPIQRDTPTCLMPANTRGSNCASDSYTPSHDIRLSPSPHFSLGCLVLFLLLVSIFFPSIFCFFCLSRLVAFLV